MFRLRDLEECGWVMEDVRKSGVVERGKEKERKRTNASVPP